MGEVWKPISVYNRMMNGDVPKYWVSNLGRVKTAEYISSRGKPVPSRMLTPGKTDRGHEFVSLHNGRGEVRTFGVHILVALEFVPNPAGHRFVKHKNNDFSDSSADNLEWTGHRPGYLYKNPVSKLRANNAVTVRKYTLSGEFIAEYPSLRSAADSVGVTAKAISDCCRRRQKVPSIKGYLWRVAGDDEYYSDKALGVAKAVNQYSIRGEFIQRFESIADAAEAVCVRGDWITACCLRRCRTVRDFIWRYADDALLKDGVALPKLGDKCPQSVRQYSPDGVFVAEYRSVATARRSTGVFDIGECCTRLIDEAGGFIWRFACDDEFVKV